MRLQSIVLCDLDDLDDWMVYRPASRFIELFVFHSYLASFVGRFGFGEMAIVGP